MREGGCVRHDRQDGPIGRSPPSSRAALSLKVRSMSRMLSFCSSGSWGRLRGGGEQRKCGGGVCMYVCMYVCVCVRV